MRELDELFVALSQSRFRAKFKLRGRELQIVRDKGIDVVIEHASKIIRERLAPANIPNDGKQTPWRNHPVFVAQHATATCCRGCLEKWHRIPRGHALREEEIQHILSAIRRWLVRQQALPSEPRASFEKAARTEPRPPGSEQLNLFEAT